MQWNDDAKAAVAKAPFFIRGMITRRVEEYVREQKRDTVTLADVKYLRDKQGQAAIDEMSADDIERMVRSKRPQLIADARTYEVKACSIPNCPRALFDVQRVGEQIAQLIEESRVAESVVKRTNGPILRHHMLTVSISGCPNSCSQPQIADFGVQGRIRPAVGAGICTNCGECVSVCRESSISLSEAGPEIITTSCIDCGDCGAACPTGALVSTQPGFSILAGGKLGRHPQLARTLFDFADEAMLLTTIQAICDIFADDVRPGERLANTIDRIGVDEIIHRCNARR